MVSEASGGRHVGGVGSGGVVEGRRIWKVKRGSRGGQSVAVVAVAVAVEIRVRVKAVVKKVMMKMSHK
ncbi:hypothetical protein NL676_038773 [Syzygium grande]|nr:hypothetical protein NL676_038773 [Syzygium grande]